MNARWRRAGSSAWQRPYRPLVLPGLLVQLAVVVGSEVLLFRTYGRFDSSFHWAAHFLVGVTAAMVFLTGYLVLASTPARGQVLVVLAMHLFAMAPDLLFRLGIPHAPWMEIFLGHITVHYVPGGDRTWLVVALLSLGGYALVLSRWLAARTAEAELGLAPGIGIGGRAVLRPQADPRSTVLSHLHEGTAPGSPPFLLLHGLGANAQLWRPVAHELARLGATVLAPDLLGFGGSMHIGTRFTLADQCDAVLLLLDHHELDLVRLVGHSYGCTVAAELARLAPQRVADATLVCPPLFPDPETSRQRLGRRSWLARRTLAGAPVANALCGLMCLARAPAMRLAPVLARQVPAPVARGGVQHTFPSYRDALDTLLSDNPLPAWVGAPQVPTRLVLANEDETAPVSEALAVPRSREVVVVRTQGGHSLPLERATWLSELLSAPWDQNYSS